MIDRTSSPSTSSARAQHGLITDRAGRRRRWGRSRKAPVGDASGRLISVQPSVFRLAGAPETWHQSLHGRGAGGRRGSSRTARPRSCGASSSRPATSRSRSRRTTPPTVRPPAIVHRIKDLRPGLAVEREGLRSPTRCGRSSTSASWCRRWLGPASDRRGHLDEGSFTVDEVQRAPRRARSPGPERHRDRRAILDGQRARGREGGERAREAVHRPAPAVRPASAHAAARGVAGGPLRGADRRRRTRS